MYKELIKNILEKANHIGYLATIDDGAPRVRPIDMYIGSDDSFLTATFSNSNKLKQLKKCDLAEICFSDGNDQLVRISGHMIIIADVNTKTEFASLNPHVNNDFQGIDDPYYTLLKLEPTKVEVVKSGSHECIEVEW